jgi:YhcG PDDEXK nuclease domain
MEFITPAWQSGRFLPVDDLLFHADDKPSIGIILCKSKNQVVAEYALRDLAKPVGVSSYITKLVESLPPALRGSLPSPKVLEDELLRDPRIRNNGRLNSAGHPINHADGEFPPSWRRA